jgi:hypothetical protein
MNKNTGALIDATTGVGLEVNVEKTKYILVSHHQNVGQNWDTQIANRTFEHVSQFRNFEMAVTSQNLI